MLGKCVNCINFVQMECEKKRLPKIGENEINKITGKMVFFNENKFIKTVNKNRFCLDFKNGEK